MASWRLKFSSTERLLLTSKVLLQRGQTKTFLYYFSYSGQLWDSMEEWSAQNILVQYLHLTGSQSFCLQVSKVQCLPIFWSNIWNIFKFIRPELILKLTFSEQFWWICSRWTKNIIEEFINIDCIFWGTVGNSFGSGTKKICLVLRG